MAAQSLPVGGSISVQRSLLHGNVKPQPGQKSLRASLISHRKDVINARLATEEMSSKPRKSTEKSVNLSPISQADNLGKAGFVEETMKLGPTEGQDNEEQTGVSVTTDKLDQWMAESVLEIVRHIHEAPFLYYVFEINVPSTTPKRQRLTQDGLKEEDGWPNLRNLLRNVLPDGVTLVKRLDQHFNNANEYSTDSESESGNEIQGFDRTDRDLGFTC